MTGASSILIILANHDRRVRVRKLAEEKLGLTVHSEANAIEALRLLHKTDLPQFILLSSEALPLMSYQEFLIQKAADPKLAAIPVVLLSLTPVGDPLPAGVALEVKFPISLSVLKDLVLKFA